MRHPRTGKAIEVGEENSVKSIVASEMNANVLWTIVGGGKGDVSCNSVVFHDTVAIQIPHCTCGVTLG